ATLGDICLPQSSCNKAVPLRTISGFNPHPTRRLDATSETLIQRYALREFQSSSNPKVGCYDVAGQLPSLHVRVSILIQPEGWMLLLGWLLESHPELWFQSSSNPRVGCYVRARLAALAALLEFQSSSNPKVGCYHERSPAYDRSRQVSILI